MPCYREDANKTTKARSSESRKGLVDRSCMYVEVFWNRVPLIRLPVAHRDADPEIAVKLVTIRAAHCGQQARSASAGTVEPKAIDSREGPCGPRQPKPPSRIPRRHRDNRRSGSRSTGNRSRQRESRPESCCERLGTRRTQRGTPNRSGAGLTCGATRARQRLLLMLRGRFADRRSRVPCCPLVELRTRACLGSSSLRGCKMSHRVFGGEVVPGDLLDMQA